MDFKQLESFIAIAKLKSFSKAAEKLYLTQPTISNHIHILEKELDTILFNRTNKNITLTSAGEVLYEHAVSLINKKEHAFFSLNQFKGKIEGCLEISSSTIPEQYYLTNIIQKFHDKYPDVTFNLMKYDTQQVIDKILFGEIDFGIVGAKKESKQLSYLEILGDEIVLITNPNSEFAAKGFVTMDDFSKMNLILRESGSGTRTSATKFLEENGVNLDTLKIVAEVESNETIKRFVELGMGLSLVSKRSVEDELQLEKLKIIPIQDKTIERKFYFVFHKKRVLSPLSETFKTFLIQQI